MSRVSRFISKAMRITSRKAEDSRQAILDLALPKQAETDILVTIQRYETGGQSAQWSFTMISPTHAFQVWNILGGGKFPHETRSVFFCTLTHIETNTGVVTLTREEIADRAGISPEHVSAAMGRLEKLGVIFRERVKIPGMRGRGRAQYRLNPHVSWKGSLENRAEAARDADQRDLPFEVIDGGGDNAA